MKIVLWALIGAQAFMVVMNLLCALARNVWGEVPGRWILGVYFDGTVGNALLWAFVGLAGLNFLLMLTYACSEVR